MILGIGIDLLDMNRIGKLYEKCGDRLTKRILSDTELKNFTLSNNKKNFLAKKFSAKEAFLKALGIGIGRGVSLKDISIENNILGKPIIILSDDGYNFIEKHYKINIKQLQFDISITDELPYINCFVIISYN